MLSLTIVFCCIFVAIAILDYWLVSTGRRSISLTVWMAEQAHPTLIVFIMLVGLGLAWAARSVWGVQATVLISLGHIVTTEGAAIATLTNKSRWLCNPFKKVVK